MRPRPRDSAPSDELDAHLRRAVRRTAFMRQGFYVVVLLVALAGQVSGAVEAFHIPLAAAIPAVGALELGGVVVMANADVRRRLGERATASRLLSVMVAAGAVAFNWLAHADHLLGGFFAGMSALGYLVWLMHTENQRRDRLRAKGTLPPTTPAYEFVGHWLRHPWLTGRAKSLAKADPHLGLYESLACARDEIRRERRQSAISSVLHRKIRAAVDPTTADIAVAVYDLDEIAKRLADTADYHGLTTLISADLAPAKLAAETQPVQDDDDRIRVLPPAVRRDIEDLLQLRQRATAAITSAAEVIEPQTPTHNPEPAVPVPAAPSPVGSLRSRVHATLDAHVTADDVRDNAALIEMVTDVLHLNEVERMTAATYVRTWKRDTNARHRAAAPPRQLKAVGS